MSKLVLGGKEGRLNYSKNLKVAGKDSFFSDKHPCQRCVPSKNLTTRLRLARRDQN